MSIGNYEHACMIAEWKENVNMKRKNYYLGLDIGTDSVGYAVVNPKTYDVIKFKGTNTISYRKTICKNEFLGR